MKQTSKLSCVLACILLVLFIVPACSSEDILPSDTSHVEPTIEYFTLNPAVKIIRATDEFTTEISSAALMIKQAAVSLIGEEILLAEDWYRGELVRNEFEILLGRTNRPESESAYASLSYYDYMYEVVSPGCVVICGGNDSATLLAAEKFILDCYGYINTENAGMMQDIPVGTSYTYKHPHSLESLELCGEDISTFSLVYPAKASYKKAAESIRNLIGKKSGANLALVPLDKFEGGNAVFVGCAAADGSHLYSSYGPYNYIVKQEQRGNFTHVILDSTAYITKVAESFCDTFLEAIPEKGSYAITIPTEPLILNICGDALNGFVFVSKTEEIIDDGVVYSKRAYKDINGAPVIAHIMEVDLTKVDILNATPQYGDEIHNVKATTLQAIQAVEKNGFEVLAGVNADFFRINSDYSPQGLCIKEGRVLYVPGSSGDWFGITNDGKAVINNIALYESTYKGTLKEAVGGRYIVLRNGFYYNIAYDTEGSTRHPRTAVGIKPDGNLLFVVIDGRQPTLSNGASLADLAQLFIELGATDAINLDGGGSSSILTVSSSGDSFITRNSPSDGKLRSVYNSLVIVKKK